MSSNDIEGWVEFVNGQETHSTNDFWKINLIKNNPHTIVRNFSHTY
jgi:hypothetical protein